MKSNPVLHAASALSLLFCLLPAHADPHYARASASLTNITVAWDDLDYEDGVTAGVWLSTFPESLSRGSGRRDGMWQSDWQTDRFDQLDMVFGYGEIHNAVEPRALSSSVSATLPDSLLIGTTSLSYSYYATQNTMVRFTADAFSDIAHSGVGGGRTEIVMNMYMYGQLRSTSRLASDGGVLSEQFFGSNYTFSEGYGEVQFLIETTAATELLPIPEPHSYAMMLAGFAVLGGVARRRKPAGLPAA